MGPFKASLSNNLHINRLILDENSYYLTHSNQGVTSLPNIIKLMHRVFFYKMAQSTLKGCLYVYLYQMISLTADMGVPLNNVASYMLSDG